MKALRPLVQVDEAYLMAAFSAIERKYGTMARYFSKEIGLSPDAIEELQRTLLVPDRQAL